MKETGRAPSRFGLCRRSPRSFGARSVSEGALPTIKFHPSEASPQTDERCVAELSCNALPRPATESGSRPRHLAPKVHHDNSPGQRPGDRWVDTRQPEGLREILLPVAQAAEKFHSPPLFWCDTVCHHKDSPGSRIRCVVRRDVSSRSGVAVAFRGPGRKDLRSVAEAGPLQRLDSEPSR